MGWRLISEFENTLTGHNGVAGTPGGGVIYRPGKFGQGVQVAEATTNLVTNPSFEVNTTGWFAASFSTLTRTNADSAIGDYCLLAVSGGGQSYAQAAISGLSISGTSTYTFSTYIKNKDIPIGANVQMLVNWQGGANLAATVTTTVVSSDALGSDWRRISATFTPDYTDRTAANFYVRFLGVTANSQGFYLDAAQLEAKAYVTPYCDGSLGTGHSWSGTAHASTSSRTVATLTYPVSVIDGAEGAVSMWVNHASNPAALILFGSGASGQFDAFVDSINRVAFRMNDVQLTTTTTITMGTWNHLVFTWSASQNKREIFINGALAASRQYDTGFTLGATVMAFHRPYLLTTINGVGDQFATIDRAITAAEVS